MLQALLEYFLLVHSSESALDDPQLYFQPAQEEKLYKYYNLQL